MSAHTPGPWTHSGDGIIRGANGVVVADARTLPGVRSDHEMVANVALPVRAPEIPGLEAQRDALADALIERMDATLPKYWRRWEGRLDDDNDRGGHYRRIFAALRAAGRLKGENDGVST